MPLSHDEKVQIQMLAEGLSQKEVCEYLGWDVVELNEDQDRLKEFQTAYNQGRAQFKLYAVNKLKESMSGKTGMQASLAVLTRFAEEWPTQSEENDLGIQKSFRIVLDD